MFVSIFNACIIILLLLLPGCASTPDPKPTSEANEQAPRAPFVWGSFSESKGCVIFQENEKTDFGFYVVAFTWKKRLELEVIESMGYNLQQKIWVENQENKDKLHHLAIKDGIRYVKLMEDYTPEELQMARELCRKPTLDPK